MVEEEFFSVSTSSLFLKCKAFNGDRILGRFFDGLSPKEQFSLSVNNFTLNTLFLNTFLFSCSLAIFEFSSLSRRAADKIFLVLFSIVNFTLHVIVKTVNKTQRITPKIRKTVTRAHTFAENTDRGTGRVEKRRAQLGKIVLTGGKHRSLPSKNVASATCTVKTRLIHAAPLDEPRSCCVRGGCGVLAVSRYHVRWMYGKRGLHISETNGDIRNLTSPLNFPCPNYPIFISNSIFSNFGVTAFLRWTADCRATQERRNSTAARTEKMTLKVFILSFYPF